eukprot:TRINITY_DN4577_c0_g2_i1.p1 TRINITY_DN4577_c0_g2~~TRINITY_DN4577_c0_g2_i1.p1  ORF type:complete len:603 (+),score=119.59 TRINITY_DN4577_c0_g2_i1:89-1897(+)
MIDKFVIFTKGGIVVWSKAYTKHNEPKAVNAMIKAVLLENRNESKYIEDNAALHWVVDNKRDLVFVVQYARTLKLKYIQDLLKKVKENFSEQFGEQLNDKSILFGNSPERYNFTSNFDRIYATCTLQLAAVKKKPTKQRSFADTKKGKEKIKRLQETGEDAAPLLESVEQPGNDEPVVVEEKDIQRHMKRLGRMGRSSPKKFKRKKNKTKASPKSQQKKKGKKPRRWEPETDEKLDYVLKKPDNAKVSHFDQNKKVDLTDWNDLIPQNDSDSDSDTDSDSSDDSSAKKPAKKSGWFLGSVFSGLTNRAITEESIAPVLKVFRDKLIEKNVAANIAEELCDSVSKSLVGQTMSTFSRIKSTVHETLKTALTRILTPKHSVNVISEIKRVVKTGRPYSIVFVGVNGVGKSTNLAKICNYLLQENFNVMMCACDTFRAGAVEQLQTHARCLGVDLHQQGYIKDPAVVAQNGLHKAKKEHKDVVLIDTAGRMQNNKPLMTALAKLVYLNNPDLILFVGEALVGNEAVDQLREFNRALEDFAPAHISRPRGIDGIVLTKFDTVDDKVGAAISMTHITGQPIVFVGTGQKYPDLKKMHPEPIIQALLS